MKSLNRIVAILFLVWIVSCVTTGKVQKRGEESIGMGGGEYAGAVTGPSYRAQQKEQIKYVIPPEIRNSKDYEKFEEYLKLIEQDPTLADVHYNIGVLYTKYKKYDYAAKAYENALKIRPDYVEAAVNLADAYRHLGKNKAAEVILKRLLRENPDEIRLLNALAIVYREEGKLDESLKLSLKVLKKDQKYLPARLNVGLIYLLKKKYAMAYYVFDTSKDLAPNNPAIHEYKGYTLYFLQDYEGAEKEFRKALKLDPGKPEIYVDLALIKMKQEKWKEAEKLLLKALKIKPLMGEAHLDLGVVYLKMGKLKEAYRELKKALKYGADRATVYYNLAIVASLYRRKPDVAAKKAIEYFRKYLEYATNLSPEKRKEIENLIKDIQDVGVEVVYLYKPLFSQLPPYARPKEEGAPEMAYGNESTTTSYSQPQTYPAESTYPAQSTGGVNAAPQPVTSGEERQVNQPPAPVTSPTSQSAPVTTQTTPNKYPAEATRPETEEKPGVSGAPAPATAPTATPEKAPPENVAKPEKKKPEEKPQASPRGVSEPTEGEKLQQPEIVPMEPEETTPATAPTDNGVEEITPDETEPEEVQPAEPDQPEEPEEVQPEE